MNTFLVSFVFFALTIFGLAIGVIFSQKTLKGSCGGLNAIPNDKGESICGLCQHPVHDCQQKTTEV